jgi:hypothetical protein
MWIYKPTPHTPSWRSSQFVKKRDNFTLPFTEYLRLFKVYKVKTVFSFKQLERSVSQIKRACF